MEIKLKLNENLDSQMIFEFSKFLPEIIFNSLPLKERSGLKLKGEIKNLVREYYKNEQVQFAGQEFLKRNKDKLLKIAAEISTILEEEWPQKTTVTIIPAVCPISPRFLEENSFMIPFYNQDADNLKLAAHEMVHFLYFKKLKKLFPKTNPKTLETPFNNWKISEIVAPIVVNDSRLQKILETKDTHYTEWQKVKIEGKNINEIFEKVYQESANFEDFIKKTYKEFNRLNKNHGLGKKLK